MATADPGQTHYYGDGCSGYSESDEPRLSPVCGCGDSAHKPESWCLACASCIDCCECEGEGGTMSGIHTMTGGPHG